MTEKKSQIKIAAPASRKQIVSQNSAMRSKQITKASIQQYLDSFFNTNGKNHTLLELIAPNGLQYITDKSFTERDNPLKRKLFINRMYEQTKEHLPAIIIADTSYDPKIELRGLGSLTDAKLENGIWKGEYPIVATIGIHIMVLTKTEEANTVLYSILDAAFSSMRNIGDGSYICSREAGDYWSVKLPLIFDGSGTEKELVGEDNVDSVYISSIDIQPMFEDTLFITQDGPEFIRNVNPYGISNNARFDTFIDFPDSVQVSQRQKLVVYNLREGHDIVLSDPNIATINPSTLIITPRKLGTFTIQIVDMDTVVDNSDAFPSYKVVKEKEVTVVW